MKLLKIATIAGAMLFGGITASQAHSHNSSYASGYLSGSTMMKVHNNSDYTIIGIQSSNSEYGTTYRWGSPLAMNGVIFPHSTAIVNFGDNTDACVFFVQIITSDGRRHIYGNVNVCRQNNITVSDW